MKPETLSLKERNEPVSKGYLEDYLDKKDYVTKEFLQEQNYVTKQYLQDQNYVTKEFLMEQNYATKEFVQEGFEHILKIMNEYHQITNQRIDALMDDNNHKFKILIELFNGRFERI